MTSLRTPRTPSTPRAIIAARSFSASLFANPESCVTPFSVSTLIAVAATSGSEAILALIVAVIFVSSM